MLAAPVKLSMLLTLEANCILLPSWSGVQACTPTQSQIPVETPPSPTHKGKTGVLPFLRMGWINDFFWCGFTVFLHSKVRLWFAPLSKCAASVLWKAGVGARHLGHLSSPADLHHFSLFFSRNKQVLRPNLLHTDGKYKSKLGMLSIHQQSRTACSNSTRDPHFKPA